MKKFAYALSLLLLPLPILTGCTNPADLTPQTQAEICGHDLRRIYVGMPEHRMVECYLGKKYQRPYQSVVVGGEKHDFYIDPWTSKGMILVVNGEVAGWVD